MFFQTQREAAGYIASKLADTRKEAVKVSLPLRELNTAPLLGMILEADPRLLFCLEDWLWRPASGKTEDPSVFGPNIPKCFLLL